MNNQHKNKTPSVDGFHYLYHSGSVKNSNFHPLRAFIIKEKLEAATMKQNENIPEQFECAVCHAMVTCIEDGVCGPCADKEDTPAHYQCAGCGDWFKNEDTTFYGNERVCYDCENEYVELKADYIDAERAFRSQSGGPHYVGGQSR